MNKRKDDDDDEGHHPLSALLAPHFRLFYYHHLSYMNLPYKINFLWWIVLVEFLRPMHRFVL